MAPRLIVRPTDRLRARLVIDPVWHVARSESEVGSNKCALRGTRVSRARHLGELLSRSAPRHAPPLPEFPAVTRRAAEWEDQVSAKYAHEPEAAWEFNDFQQGLREATEQLGKRAAVFD